MIDITDTGANAAQTDATDTTSSDLIIIGSGPAGYTAAIYAARAELSPIVFEGIEYGGSLMTTTDVENYPGFPEGIMGPELMENMRTQAEKFGATLIQELVDEVSLEGPTKKVVAGGKTYEAKAVILAMGAEPRYLGVPGEKELLGRGVSACATCDGFFFRDKDIAVIGGGDSAMEEATFLTRFAKTVTIVHRREEFRASAIMLERAKSNPKIKFLTNSVVARVNGEEKVESLTLKDVVSGDESTLDVEAMFVAIGLDPRSALVNGQLELGAGGYIPVNEPQTTTTIPGVFAAGDLVDAHYKQAVTAAGSGCRAAIDAEHYLAAQ